MLKQLQLISLALSPQGHLYLDAGPLALEEVPLITAEKIKTLFAQNVYAGVLHLGIENFHVEEIPSFSFWQRYAHLFMTEICKSYGLSDNPVSAPSQQELQEIISQAPFMKGSEYLHVELLKNIWQLLTLCLTTELKLFDNNLENYLQHYNPSWNQVGRVCLHLAENKTNDKYPFAFLATYTSRLSQHAKLQHIPLQKALQEYAGKQNNEALLKLLLPLQKATNQSILVKKLVETNDIFKPMMWTAQQAHQFLKDIPLLESCGIMIRIPDWWNPKKPSRPQVSITIGNNKESKLGLDSLVEFDLHFALNTNEELTEQEWEQLLSSGEKFVKVKGQWIEVDQEKLQEVLSHWRKVQQQVRNNGLSFAEGLRLLAGISKYYPGAEEHESDMAQWFQVASGTWLKETLQALRNPQAEHANNIFPIFEKNLKATLRPYQIAGVQWLWLLYSLKLGGCLADDMGLGKTIQVLSLLLLINYFEQKKQPTLLVVPASLLGNWQAEVVRFAPSLQLLIVHSSAGNFDKITPEKIKQADVVMTTYAVLYRMPILMQEDWNLIVLDEAQMIKNPGTKQTKAVKILKSKVRFTLTGTPIENHLGDLWSLFDFTSPGLLGSRMAFIKHEKKPYFFSALRALVSPYILRRLKSDKSIIQDLPDKTEIQAYCALSKQQAVLYQQAVDQLAAQLEDLGRADDIQRRGLILSYILRFKQICNHPDQWLGYGNYSPEFSGKFLRIKEICEQIAAKQEKVLIFTQFREIIPPLANFVAKIFGHEGLILHGQTPVKQRAQLVKMFQQEYGAPFFILSLKAGGTGLNLTNASHVIHFDRWWNPAVENQATDRAYRIGQKKNVLVHKFVCKGTIEEKIDDLILSKKTLSQEILSKQDEVALTKLSDEDLIKIVSLDLNQVLNENT